MRCGYVAAQLNEKRERPKGDWEVLFDVDDNGEVVGAGNPADVEVDRIELNRLVLEGQNLSFEEVPARQLNTLVSKRRIRKVGVGRARAMNWRRDCRCLSSRWNHILNAKAHVRCGLPRRFIALGRRRPQFLHEIDVYERLGGVVSVQFYRISLVILISLAFRRS